MSGPLPTIPAHSRESEGYGRLRLIGEPHVIMAALVLPLSRY